MPLTKGMFGGGGGMSMGTLQQDSGNSDFDRIAGALRKKRRKEEVQRLRAEQKKNIAELRKSQQQFSRTSERVGESVGQFGRVALQQQEDPFTTEQHAMRQMFGGGDKFWGANDPVHINHDLQPRQRGDMGTANLFGFGGRI